MTLRSTRSGARPPTARRVRSSARRTFRLLVFCLPLLGITACRNAAPVTGGSAGGEEPRASSARTSVTTAAPPPVLMPKEPSPPPTGELTRKTALAGPSGGNDKGNGTGAKTAARDDRVEKAKGAGGDGGESDGDDVTAVTPKRKPRPSPPRRRPAQSREEKSLAEASYRAGALRLTGAGSGVYELAFTPGPGPALPRLRAKLKQPEAVVTPFAQRTDGEGEHVKRGGEIAAIAIALQLEKMGWLVDVAARGQLARGLRAPQASTRASVAFQVSGRVLFLVVEREARLSGSVRFARGGTLAHSVEVSVRAPLEGGLPSVQRRRAAEEALRRFVAAVLADPRLDAALAAAVR